ncbi:MAG: hypothetical protein GXP25_25345 [Planctomycetes bacterium]|nr:hypothetical protein [Planctomycetota bacterium]
MADQKIADLTMEEFKDLVREVVAETVMELLGDPDKGLELREDVRRSLEISLATVQDGGETIPAKEVAERLGLQW